MNNSFEQVGKPDFFKQLDICCQKIAQKTGKEDITAWKNSDYIRLSALLYRETKVTLSGNTLKRIFGKLKTPKRYYPQKATRDALVQFIGFRDWYEFELLHPIPPDLQSTPIKTTEIFSATHAPQEKKYSKYILFIVLFSLALIALIKWGFQEKAPGNVNLICLNPEGHTPHSAIFKLGIEGQLGDTPSAFTIDFRDDKRQKSNFQDSLVNHYYETPGRFYPILYHDGKAIDTATVYLQTDGWNATVDLEKDTSRVYPILHRKFDLNQAPYVSIKDVYHAGVDTNQTFFVSFANIKPTTISADNLELKAQVSTSLNRPGVRCSQIDVILYGEYDCHSVSIMKPECVAWSYYKFSELFRDGGSNDLRALGHDLSNGGNLRLRIADKEVELFVNDKRILQAHYKKPIGNLMGIKIMFSGIGAIDQINLTDLQTGVQFSP